MSKKSLFSEKKLIVILLLSFTLSFSSVGCKQSSSNTQQNKTTDTEQITLEPTPFASQSNEGTQKPSPSSTVAPQGSTPTGTSLAPTSSETPKTQPKNSITPRPKGTKPTLSAPDVSSNLQLTPTPVKPVKYPGIDFTLKDRTGKTFSLSSFTGKNVFLNFWATWCPPCRAELPDIEKISKENSNVVVITVNVGEEPDVASEFMKKNGYNFTVLLDSDSSVFSGKYKLNSIPWSFFINKDGKVVSKHNGSMSHDVMLKYINGL